MFKCKYFLLAVIVFVVSSGLLHQPTVHASQETDDRIAKLEKEIAEIRTEIESIKNMIRSMSVPFSTNNSIKEGGEEDSRAWLSPLMGWEADYTNDRLYALNSSGGVDNVNVGIGTNSPLTPFHLVGDFYNQGFAGAKSNFNPGVANWSNVAEVTITTHGTGEDNSVVLIYAHVPDYAGMSFYDIFVRVIRGGTVVAIACEGAFGGYMGATLISYDEPPPGTYTYTLQLESVVAPASGYNFVVVELKR